MPNTSTQGPALALSQAQQDALDAQVLRRLLAHLDDNKDVQNIDLMILSGFCRNCLSKWYKSAADDAGHDIDMSQAQERVYGMAYGEWKANYQTKASPQQLAAFAARKPQAN